MGYPPWIRKEFCGLSHGLMGEAVGISDCLYALFEPERWSQSRTASAGVRRANASSRQFKSDSHRIAAVFRLRTTN